MVPAPVVTYNMFMGSVDIMDQKREATYKKRREKQLSTNIFNHILSLACLNVHAIYNKLLQGEMIEGEHLTHSEFKRQLAQQLCVADNPISSTHIPTNLPCPLLITEEVSSFHSHQMYRVDENQYMPTCYVCIMGIKKRVKVNMICRVCKLVFHTTCFTAYHNSDSMEEEEARTFLKSICPCAKRMKVNKKLEDFIFTKYPFQK